jgi:hypothetical protein
MEVWLYAFLASVLRGNEFSQGLQLLYVSFSVYTSFNRASADDLMYHKKLGACDLSWWYRRGMRKKKLLWYLPAETEIHESLGFSTHTSDI